MISCGTDLFLITAKPTNNDREAIQGKFKSYHNASDRAAQLMTSTFLALLSLADISGKPKPIKVEKTEESEEAERVVEPKVISQAKYSAPSEYDMIRPNAAYCNECGSEFTPYMKQQLSSNGFVFCIHCGKGFKSERIEVEQ